VPRGTESLRPGYRALLALLISSLAIACGLFLREKLRGGPWRSHVLVASAGAPDGHPSVARFRPDYDAAKSQLRPGDRLLRVGARDLAGAKAWNAYAMLYAEAGPQGGVQLEFERGGRHFAVEERLTSEAHLWRDAALGLGLALTALLILRQAPGSPMARSFAVAALVWAIVQVQFQGGAPGQTYAYFGVRAVLGCLWAPLMILAAVQFPEGAWPASRRLPRWPWIFAALGLTWTSWWMGVPFPVEFAIRANPILGSVVIAAFLVVATRNYQLAPPAGRRQVKWVLLGCYFGLAPSLVGTVLGAVRSDLTSLWFASQWALFAVPVCIFIAVTRSNLLDIDRLISGTASFTILLVAFGAAALTLLPWLADRASARVGIDPSAAHVGLAVVLALLAVRLEPLLRPRFERMFFAERQAFRDGIVELVAEIQGAPDPAALAQLLGGRLDALLRSEFCVIYARGADAFAPIFARHCPITPHFEPDGPFVSALAQRVSAVDLERDRAIAERADAAERAELIGLGAAVLVPVVRDRMLLALVALGRKGSGDVYTPTDLALLSLVGGSVSAWIARFDAGELLREARALQDKLRQYVPASIADELARGRDLEAGERVISVLFADLRGYTSLAEGRHAEEIFRIVNRYTEAVTRVVTEHGGTVVEFNGDGMMAVFGAPGPLPDKERRALAAARRIVSEVSALESPVLGPGGGRLAVGVGLATGAAYVGPIRSVDRRIWSAIGDTTNLAARLQALSREFGAPIVIDSATHDAAREDALDFERRPQTPIRGLRAPRDVFVLPHQRVAA
jgi:class 3 adenylate cyclase